LTRQTETGPRVQPGLEPWPADPYAGMTDDELARELDPRLPDRNRVVWVRLPERLLERTRDAAERQGVPYQGLIRRILEASLERLDMGSGQGP
jgi:CopG antitoxin of type II toxin-antitoxin system